jgi:hypothetical protein
MPAMTNPEGYTHEFYDPEHPTKRGIMGHSTEEEKEKHVCPFCGACF